MSTTAFSTSVEILPKPQKRKQLCKFTDKILFLFVHCFKSLWYSDLNNFDEFQVPDIFPYVLLEFFFVTVAFLNISPDSVHFLARDDQPNPQNNQKEELKEGRISKFESFGLGEYESQRRKSPKCILQCTYRSNGGHPSCPWVKLWSISQSDILSILVIISRGLRYTLPLIPLSRINHHFLLS